MQLKLYATRKSISSPISSDYEARAENEVTIKLWHKDQASKSIFISTTYIVFPVLVMIITICAVYYYNDSKENNRMFKIKRILSRKDNYGKKVVMYELQNEVIVSLMFCIYVIILSIFGVYSTVNHTYLNKHVEDYFSINNLSTNLEFSASLAIITLTLDLIVVVAGHIVLLVIGIVVVIKTYLRRRNRDHGELEDSESQNDGNSNSDKPCLFCWRYCAYSILFPLCLIMNHFNYIVIAFTHNVYHAIGVATLYGVIIAILFGALLHVSYCYDKCLFWGKIDDYEPLTNERDIQASSRDIEASSRDIDISKYDITYRALFCLLILKISVAIFLVGCLLFDILLYYFTPTKDFDNITNHLITLYQTTALFFAAVSVYFFLRNRNRSAIGILTQAEYKAGIMKNDRSLWSILPDEERDLEMAKEILNVLKDVKNHYEPRTNEAARR